MPCTQLSKKKFYNGWKQIMRELYLNTTHKVTVSLYSTVMSQGIETNNEKDFLQELMALAAPYTP